MYDLILNFVPIPSWACTFRRQSLVARRARWGPPRRTRSPSISTGTNSPTAPAAACCCRSSARPMSRRWSAVTSSCAMSTNEASFSALGISRTPPADRAGQARRNATDDRARGGCCATSRCRQGHPRRSRRVTGEVAASQSEEAPALRVELKAIAGAAKVIARGLSAYRAGEGRPAANCSRCIICSNASTTSSAIGGLRPATSATAVSSASTISPASASRTPARSRRSSAREAIDRRRQAAGVAARPYRRLVRSGAISAARRLIRHAQGGGRPFYLVIEKILGEHEQLPHLPAFTAPRL